VAAVLLGGIAAGPGIRADDALHGRVVAPPTPENPRNTEADIVPLQGGRLLLVYHGAPGDSPVREHWAVQS